MKDPIDPQRFITRKGLAQKVAGTKEHQRIVVPATFWAKPRARLSDEADRSFTWELLAKTDDQPPSRPKLLSKNPRQLAKRLQ